MVVTGREHETVYEMLNLIFCDACELTGTRVLQLACGAKAPTRLPNGVDSSISVNEHCTSGRPCPDGVEHNKEWIQIVHAEHF